MHLRPFKKLISIMSIYLAFLEEKGNWIIIDHYYNIYQVKKGLIDWLINLL